MALDKTFAECLTELETKATVDMELLSGNVVDCVNEMAGIGASTEAGTDNDDDGYGGAADNQIEITGQQNRSSPTS